MKYFKAYLRALRDIILILGGLYLLGSVYFRGSAVADYLSYVAALAALGGPISLSFRQKNDYEN